jgi:hypothetical protein
MNTRQSIVKRAHELRVGDIVDISTVALGFGYRYHQVLTTPRPDGSKRFLGRVFFDMRLVGHTALELRDPEPFNWPLNVDGDAPMRVLLSAPRCNHKQ